MSENQYNAPAMEVVEFGKGDAVCTASTGWEVTEVPGSWEVTGPWGVIDGGSVKPERPGELPDEITG